MQTRAACTRTCKLRGSSTSEADVGVQPVLLSSLTHFHDITTGPVFTICRYIPVQEYILLSVSGCSPAFSLPNVHAIVYLAVFHSRQCQIW